MQQLSLDQGLLLAAPASMSTSMRSTSIGSKSFDQHLERLSRPSERSEQPASPNSDTRDDAPHDIGSSKAEAKNSSQISDAEEQSTVKSGESNSDVEQESELNDSVSPNAVAITNSKDESSEEDDDEATELTDAIAGTVQSAIASTDPPKAKARREGEVERQDAESISKPTLPVNEEAKADSGVTQQAPTVAAAIETELGESDAEKTQSLKDESQAAPAAAPVETTEVVDPTVTKDSAVATVTAVNNDRPEETGSGRSKDRGNARNTETRAAKDSAAADGGPVNNAAPAEKQQSTESSSAATTTSLNGELQEAPQTTSAVPAATRHLPADTQNQVTLRNNSDSSPVAAGNEAHSGTNLSEADRVRFVQRVAKAFRSFEDSGGQMRLRLSPPELGSLRLEVIVKDGVMAARLEAETVAAKTLLTESLPMLRERLADQNIRVERFDVDLMNNQSDEMQHHSFEEQHQRQPAVQRGPARSNIVTSDPNESSSTTTPAAHRSNTQLNVII